MYLYENILKKILATKIETPTINDLAEYISVPVRVLNAWIIDDILPEPRTIGKLTKRYALSIKDPKLLKKMVILQNTHSYATISKATGIPTSTFNDWLLFNQKPHLKNLSKLADWLQLPIHALLLETDSIDSPEVKILKLMQQLTPDQKQQIAEQMEQVIQQT